MSDLISRQALRDAMYHEAFETDTEMQRWDSGCWIRYKLFENILEQQLTVDIPHWIPCSERLPEAPTFCIVTTDGSYNDVIDIAMYMSDGWHKASKVLAWMPLPEPWKGELKDDKG